MFSDIKFFPLFLIVGFLLLNVTAAFPQQSNTNFLAARAYDGGVGFATGDFNGDGNLDVVSAKADRINLLSGNGSGFFNQPPTTIFTCASFSSNAFKQPLTSDFNGDGKTDITAWIEDNSCSGTGLRALMLLPGNGSGGFSAPIFTTVSNFFFIPDQFLSADFNGDGRPDVAVGSSFSTTDGDKVAIFLSNGGSFAAPVIYNLGGQAFFSLTVGDFNNDNRSDLIYSRRSPMDLTILPNNGDGTFGVPQTISPNVASEGIAAGDFNNDGKLDFSTVQGSTNQTIRVWLGNGNYTFSPGAVTNIPVANFGVRIVLPGDYNRDGQLDVALVLTGRIVIFKGGGNGTFTEDERYNIGGGRLFKGDFNGDGWTDLATQQTLGLQGTASGASSEFAVLLNLQDGKFLTAPSLEFPFGGEELAIADFNNDGLKDIALTGDTTNAEVLLILQEPDSRFDRPARQIKFNSADRMKMGGDGIAPRTIAAGDFNGDGKTDVVVAGRAPSSAPVNVIIAANDGAGNLSLLSTLSLGGTITKVITGDFNGDGVLDLAFSQNRETASSIVPAVSVALGTGGGAFAAPIGYLTTNVIGNSVTKGDFNGDGKLDLAVAQSNNRIAILLNNGTGGFSVGAAYDLTAAPTEIVAADLHGDGKQDLIVANNISFIADTAKISVFNGNGNGTFAAPVNYKTVWLYDQRLTVDDFNGDGRPDVSVTNNGVITVLENDGSGALTRRTLWASTGALRDIASADFDGDQKIDLVTTSAASGFFSLSFLPNITTQTVNRPAKFDFDGDGKADISVFRPSNGAWYLQQSANGFTGVAFGFATDKIVPADYDGDGKTDVAVYRNGTWYLQRSQSGFTGVSFGTSSDIPVPADYDGDGKTDVAVYRPSTGIWYIYNLTTNQTNAVQFGASEDKPIAADYDGDGNADVAVFRPSNGTWYIQRSNLGFAGIAFGEATDKPAPADYDGDGKADVAVFRPSNGAWYLQRSQLGFTGIAFGEGTDLPVAADYDGDGKADISVFRPSNGVWYLQRSQTGFTGVAFGASDDKPVPNAFVP